MAKIYRNGDGLGIYVGNDLNAKLGWTAGTKVILYPNPMNPKQLVVEKVD